MCLRGVYVRLKRCQSVGISLPCTHIKKLSTTIWADGDSKGPNLQPSEAYKKARHKLYGRLSLLLVCYPAALVAHEQRAHLREWKDDRLAAAEVSRAEFEVLFFYEI